MLIIFDLDDTLIDTSGSVTPFKIEVVLEAMLGCGPTYADLEELTLINEVFPRTIDAIGEFAKRHNISHEAEQEALFQLTTPLPVDFQVACTPQAKEILDYYRSLCPIALVTGGHPPFQLEKLKKAGIEASIFSKIAIPEDSIKKPFYQELFREYSEDTGQVWVCGDRIQMDLAPAQELGFNTVHMRWGRGKRMETVPWVDYSISSLSELRRIIG